jgi:hypothetical protein
MTLSHKNAEPKYSTVRATPPKKKTFTAGLNEAMKCVKDIGGRVDGSVLRLKGESATCFQPYLEIDHFYYES